MKRAKALIVTVLLLVASSYAALSADSIDVTFRYTVAGQTGVAVPGEFNNWTPANAPMTAIGGNTYVRTVRLQVGGNPAENPVSGVPGSWQYKFWYNGVATWPNDPLNPHVNPKDNDNTFIYTKDPTIYQLLPNQRNPNVTTSTPTISSYIFPKVGAAIDTSTITLTIDGTIVTGLGAYYNPGTQQLAYTLPFPLANGGHTVVLSAGSTASGTNADTVTFTTHSGFVQITTEAGYTTLDSTRLLRGVVQDTSVHQVLIVRNGADTTLVAASNGTYSTIVGLVEGVNTFQAVADSAGGKALSAPVAFTWFVNHAPTARISFNDGGGSTLDLLATTSTDPDSGQTATLSYLWSEDPGNPAVIGGINGATSPSVTISRPTDQGEYYVGLVATDVDGHSDTTRAFFDVGPAPPVTVSTLASVPQWVRQGRMYEMFFKSHTPQGTINAATPDLDRIAAMGENIIWVMPIMTNRNPMNNTTGTGYDIVDFSTVAPEYGTNQDFKNFVARAHQLGMKVILDVTPNHTSAGHPFVTDARAFRQDSRYWTYYQHQFITYTGAGLGQLSQSITPDGFVYYGAYSDELLNYNWADVDARQYMIDVYKWWIEEEGVDGYRFDSYWGPHTRANSPNGGEGEMGQPVRAALKHLRPDIHLLAEATGVGPGTEVLYSDYAGAGGPGGAESAYDWPLKDALHEANFWTQGSTGAINELDQHLRNGSVNGGMGFLPGPDAYFLRFLENHDEDRITYLFGSGVDSTTARLRTIPVSTAVNLAVGMPLVYAGQEVGRGYGIPDFDQRRRGVIAWNTYFAQLLMPHYQKLAQIRKQFPCFTTQQMIRVTSSLAGVYAYTRPSPGLNGIVVSNFDASPDSVNITLINNGSLPSVQGVVDGRAYIATDLYNGDSTRSVTFTAGLGTLSVSLPAFGVAVFVLDTVGHTLVLPPLTGVAPEIAPALPKQIELEQNYPNPFNPSTTIRYAIPRAGSVSLRIFDVLGREVRTLVDGNMPAGTHSAIWDGRNSIGQQVGTGVYFCRLTITDGGRTPAVVRKMLLLR